MAVTNTTRWHTIFVDNSFMFISTHLMERDVFGDAEIETYAKLDYIYLC